FRSIRWNGHIEQKGAHCRTVAGGSSYILVPLGQFALSLRAEPIHLPGYGYTENLLKGIAPIVVRTGVGGGVIQAVSHCSPHVIAGKFQSFDMHGIQVSVLADLFSSGLYTVCKDIPNALSECHHLDQPHHSLMVSKFEIKASGLLGSKDTLFIKFHC